MNSLVIEKTQEALENIEATLYPFQLKTVDTMLQGNPHNKSFLNFLDMGTGKSITTLTCIFSRISRGENLNLVLICCPTTAAGVWEEEINKWFPEVPKEIILYRGTPTQRKKIQIPMVGVDHPIFVISSYALLGEFLRRGFSFNWFIGDEIHSAGLLNHKTKTFGLVKETLYQQKCFGAYLLTGTPIRKGVIDLYAPLNLIDQKTFPSYWGYVNKFCITIKTPFGTQIERNPSNVLSFRTMLNQYMIRLLKTDVLTDLPSKQRNTVSIYMNSKQVDIMNKLIAEFAYLYDDVGYEEFIAVPNHLTLITKMRQLLVTPRLGGIDNEGTAVDYLQDVLPQHFERKESVVIFTPYREAVKIIADVWRTSCNGIKVFELFGGLTPAGFANTWQAFQEAAGSGICGAGLVCTIKSGASFHATNASTCYFVGAEYDFNFNVQAEDRLCRIGQTNHVQCNYLLYKDNEIDQRMKYLINDKARSADWILGSEEQVKLLIEGYKEKTK
jgi:SNF2 family DNA or RNA helicase